MARENVELATARVVHWQRARFDVYIGRPAPRCGLVGSKWANPFVVGQDGSRDEVIARYEHWLLSQPELMAALGELRGKVLGCWCPPQHCHGEVLVRMASDRRA